MRWTSPIAIAITALSLAGCSLRTIPPTSVPFSDVSLSHAPSTELQLPIATPAEEFGVDTRIADTGEPIEAFAIPVRSVAPAPAWQTNSSAQLHVNPAETLPALKALIKSAQKTLYIEVFTIADDSYGRAITPLLIDAAKRGVTVKFLCDFAGSQFSGGAKLGKQMTAAGIEFKMWSPRTIVKDNQKRGINITHRKLYLADGDRGLTGGVNLNAPFDTTTHDILIDFRGAQAQQRHEEFARDWKMAKGSALSYPALEAGKQYGSVRTQTLVTSPPEGRFEARDGIFEAIDGAQREILVEQQYLWDQDLCDRLLAAAKRGVLVRAIVPSNSDKAFKHLNYQSLNAILKAGGQARLFKGETVASYVHTKYFAVDDRIAFIGSVNGDTRALNDNQELDVAITDPGLVLELKTRLFERDWAQGSLAYEITSSRWYENPFAKLWDLVAYYL
ncbi:phosphatidylserine/phosphatidylglycerophosphate/cardiolipin synthase family protein [bacterium]|nr:phosphatidylserine/phosphatidylglycerophosphate/cardiolipin synthase family protein [bacterium]